MPRVAFPRISTGLWLYPQYVLAMHFPMVKDITLLQISLDEEKFGTIDPADGPSEKEVLSLKQDSTRTLVLNLLLHAADVSNPCKPWKICEFWARQVREVLGEAGKSWKVYEFWARQVRYAKFWARQV